MFKQASSFLTLFLILGLYPQEGFTFPVFCSDRRFWSCPNSKSTIDVPESSTKVHSSSWSPCHWNQGRSTLFKAPTGAKLTFRCSFLSVSPNCITLKYDGKSAPHCSVGTITTTGNTLEFVDPGMCRCSWGLMYCNTNYKYHCTVTAGEAPSDCKKTHTLAKGSTFSFESSAECQKKGTNLIFKSDPSETITIACPTYKATKQPCVQFTLGAVKDHSVCGSTFNTLATGQSEVLWKEPAGNTNTYKCEAKTAPK